MARWDIDHAMIMEGNIVNLGKSMTTPSKRRDTPMTNSDLKVHAMPAEKSLRETIDAFVSTLPERYSAQVISTGRVQILVVGDTPEEVSTTKHSVMTSLDAAAMSRQGFRRR